MKIRVRSCLNARDVVFQVPDDEFLIFDDILYNITDRDDAHELFVVDNRQVPDKFVRHKGHTIFDSCIR